MNKNKIRILTLAAVVSSLLFALTSISFHADISLLAFPLSLIWTAVIFFCAVSELFGKNNLKFLNVWRTLIQYHPYVLLLFFVLRRAGNFETSFIIDLISVALWCVTSVTGIVISYHLNPKRIGKLDSEWKVYTENHQLSNYKGQKRGILEALSWIDALVQAVFMVFLLNIFIVQLYEIPSESMVPEFVIRDRVLVFKTFSGPDFPLSKVGLPYLKKYDRGDIVVFRNPHYSDDRKNEVKNFMSQLIYMCTLTKVNLNVDEDGNPKADPLVKRVAGIPGEQLMMQDGILYSRTQKDDSWKVVKEDARYAEWNLNQVKASVHNKIQDFPLSQSDYDRMIQCEENRRNFDVKVFEQEAESISRQFGQAFRMYNGKREEFDLKAYFNLNNLFEYALFANHNYFAERILSSIDGEKWFNSFMTEWAKASHGDFNGNLYDEAAFKLNLMIKQLAGKILLRDIQLLVNGKSVDQLRSDGVVIDLLKQAELLNSYCFLQDRRNMCVFPADTKDGKPQYIPENCYFMMGDNRFNSLDMRHSYNEWLAPLSKYDPYSVSYLTNLQPRYVPKEKILGNASYRFWPLSRRGVPGHTGK